VSFITLAALGLGSDEDDWFQITGGYVPEGYKKEGREEVETPPRCIRIGRRKDGRPLILISYKELFPISIGCGLIGDINDRIRLNKQEFKDQGRWDDLRDRMSLILLSKAMLSTTTMAGDFSFVQGINDLIKMVGDVSRIFKQDPKKFNVPEEQQKGDWQEAAKYLGTQFAKSYFKFYSSALPTNWNIVKQFTKLLDPTQYSQKDIKSILAYASSIYLFYDKEGKADIGLYPNIGVFGYEAKFWPATSQFPYDAILGLIEDKPSLKFAAKYNSIPMKLYNTPRLVETEDGLEKRSLTTDEWHEFVSRVEMLSRNMVDEYRKNEEHIKERLEDRVETTSGEIVTGVQYDIQVSMRGRATEQATTELLRWGMVKDPDPQGEDYELLKNAWNAIKKHKAHFPYSGSGVKVGKYTLNKSELFEFNERVTVEYTKLFMRKIYNRKSSDTIKRWKEKVEIEETGKTKWDFEIEGLRTEATAKVKDEMFKELKALGKEVE